MQYEWSIDNRIEHCSLLQFCFSWNGDAVCCKRCNNAKWKDKLQFRPHLNDIWRQVIFESTCTLHAPSINVVFGCFKNKFYEKRKAEKKQEITHSKLFCDLATYFLVCASVESILPINSSISLRFSSSGLSTLNDWLFCEFVCISGEQALFDEPVGRDCGRSSFG